jgi:hypothetical protein
VSFIHQKKKQSSHFQTQTNYGDILNIEKPDWIEHISLWPKLRWSEEQALKKAINQFHPDLAISCCRSDLLGERREAITEQKGQGGSLDAFDQRSDKMWKDGTDGIPHL